MTREQNILQSTSLLSDFGYEILRYPQLCIDELSLIESELDDAICELDRSKQDELIGSVIYRLVNLRDLLIFDRDEYKNNLINLLNKLILILS